MLTGSNGRRRASEKEVSNIAMNILMVNFSGLKLSNSTGTMTLSSWTKFLILASGAAVVVFAVIVVTCFAGPGCWGFEYLMRKEKRKKIMEQVMGKSSSLHTCESPENFWTDDQNISFCRTEFFESDEKKLVETKKAERIQSKENILNVKCAPLLMSRNFYPKIHNAAPKLKVKLLYSSLKSNELMGRLVIYVMSASCLPCREYVSTVDPYVALDISSGRWSFQKNKTNIHSVQTRIIKNSRNPEFNQIFTFDGLKREIQDWCLKFTVLDKDRITRITPLFEKKVYISDLRDLSLGQPIFLDLSMQQTTKNIGNLFFGIRYLPTSQRFNINVIKAAKLRYQSHVSSLLEFYPFVRVVMLNNNGKCIKKKKTCFRQGEFSPIFNQTFIFDISLANLEQTVFLILLCTKTMQKTKNTEDTASSDGDLETSVKEGKDKVLGKIVLGRNVNCNRARQHWVSVMQNPRKMISLWHELR